MPSCRSYIVFVASLGAAVLGCTAARVEEDTAEACRNRYDDDGDGRVDCEDPSCIASGVCEVGEAACRNGLDDDGDTYVDCAQRACVEGGFCDASPAACDVVSQAGCLSGQGCYAVGTAGGGGVASVCRVAGVQQSGACSRDAIASLSAREAHPCPAGQGCASLGAASDGICSDYCADDAACPAGSMCVIVAEGRGFCSSPCSPLNGSGCPRETRVCRSVQEALGYALNQRGAYHLCLARESRAGAAPVGARCVEAPLLSTPASQICVTGSLCVALQDGALCRALCNLAAPACSSQTRCQRLYPDGRPVAFGSIEFGACAP